jgi:hypothetical protein
MAVLLGATVITFDARTGQKITKIDANSSKSVQTLDDTGLEVRLARRSVVARILA